MRGFSTPDASTALSGIDFAIAALGGSSDVGQTILSAPKQAASRPVRSLRLARSVQDSVNPRHKKRAVKTDCPTHAALGIASDLAACPRSRPFFRNGSSSPLTSKPEKRNAGRLSRTIFRNLARGVMSTWK